MLNTAKYISIIFLITLLLTGCVSYNHLLDHELTRSNGNYSSNTHVPADVKDLEGTYIGFLPCKSCPGGEIVLTLQDFNYDYRIQNVYDRSGSGFKGKFEYDVDLGRIFIDKLNVTFKVELLQDSYKLVLIDTSGVEVKDNIDDNYTLFKVKKLDYLGRAIIPNSFTPPTGYVKKGSSNGFLKNVSLTPELDYDSDKARSFIWYNSTYHASFNIRPGTERFNEGSNQIIRLLAEYNWFNKKYNRIVFRNYFDRKISYEEWLKFNFEYKGKTYESLRAYLNSLFSDGSAKFTEMEKVESDDIQVGDIFISDDYFGNAAIVIDVAQHKFYGSKIVMLAQGSKNIPGLHILLNSSNIILEKWFETDRVIFTPQGAFNIDDLRRIKYDDKETE